ncbi:hypothetical protein EZ313_05740 [Ramlibacter henchirensis]|uniref:Uncharacterized protein n=1 Tax=Ramlibacter henchirensis TaxID=204072 RepID=A0A4Z0C7S7_9BURK|nr:hypothetical protein [Ramlibacter henchirensis]TFZ06145.1 hypothetical protein EZ313_05740 [Ramlibacter henchirensis]
MDELLSAVERALAGVETARRNLEEAQRALERAEATEKRLRKLMQKNGRKKDGTGRGRPAMKNPPEYDRPS